MKRLALWRALLGALTGMALWSGTVPARRRTTTR